MPSSANSGGPKRPPESPVVSPKQATTLAALIESAWGLSSSDLRFLTLTLGLALALLGIAMWRHGAFSQQLVPLQGEYGRPYEYRLEINAAVWQEWMQLPGIGETLARRIVDDRTQHGPFGSIDEIVRVPGIGQRTLDDLRPYLFMNTPGHRADVAPQRANDSPPADQPPIEDGNRMESKL